MFNLNQFSQRVIRTPLVHQPLRRFQQYGPGPYKSGFERMIADKLMWARMETLSGMGFVFWGLANLGVYGLSKLMHKENFDYHFQYSGNGKFMQPFKSMMGADSLHNVGWTAPSLIVGGLYLQQRIGSMASLKLFGLSLMAAYLATTTLGPATYNFSAFNIRGFMPVRFDSIDTENGRMVGADLMAGICLYSVMFSHGLWIPGLAFAAFDVAYYGPMGIAMPTAAAAFALTLL